MTNTDLLKQRIAAKKKKPWFLRQKGQHIKRLKKVWRYPKGIQSKMRLQRKGGRGIVSPGYGSPVAVKGLHRSGLRIVLVHSVKDVASLDAASCGALIASSVGVRKKVDIVNAAIKRNVRILNMKDPAAFLEAVKKDLASRKESKTKKTSAKERKKQEAKSKAQEKKGIEESLSAEEKKEQEKKELDKTLTKPHQE